jgi:hypothetical protein
LSALVFPAGVTPVAHADDDPVIVSIPTKKGGGESEEAEGEAAAT